MLSAARGLQSEDPLERLSAVGRMREILNQVETEAVGEARGPVFRRSWDQIAKASSMTRWSVLRRFGPHGAHPANDAKATAQRPAAPAQLEQLPTAGPTTPDLLERLPADIAERVIHIVGELVTESIQQGRLSINRRADVRIEVLPDAIRVELSHLHPPERHRFQEIADRWGSGRGDIPSVWFELDLEPRGERGEMQPADSRS